LIRKAFFRTESSRLPASTIETLASGCCHPWARRFRCSGTFFADLTFGGPIFPTAVASIWPELETAILKRSAGSRGFVVLARRWIVERTIGRLNRCRRLAKDWGNFNRNTQAFLTLPLSAACCTHSTIFDKVFAQTLRNLALSPVHVQEKAGLMEGSFRHGLC
jgi:transposase